MNKTIKAKWIKALRSGRYKQANSTLKDITSDGVATYCCLGVLCNIRGARWRNNEYNGPEKIPFIAGKQVSQKNSDTCLLGSKFLKQVGMAPETQHTLAQMNDTGKSFREIADYIEKRL